MKLEQKHQVAPAKAVDDSVQTHAQGTSPKEKAATAVSDEELATCLHSKKLRAIGNNYREVEPPASASPPRELSFSYLDPEARQSAQKDILKMREIRESGGLTQEDARREYEELLSSLEDRLKTSLAKLDIRELCCEEREALRADIKRLQEVHQVLHKAALEEVERDAELAEDLAAIDPALAKRMADIASSLGRELERKQQELDAQISEMEAQVVSGEGNVGGIIKSLRRCRRKMTECRDRIACHGDRICEAAHELKDTHLLSDEQKQKVEALIEERRTADNSALKRVDELILESYREYSNTLLKIGERWPHLIEGYQERFRAVGALWEHTVKYRWTVGLSDSSQPLEQRKLFMFLDETVRYEASFWRGLQPWRAELTAQENSSPNNAFITETDAKPTVFQEKPDILGPVLEFSVIPTDKQSQREQQIREELRRKGVKVSSGLPTGVPERMAALVAGELLYDTEE